MRFRLILAACLLAALPAALLPEDNDAGFVNIQWRNPQIDYRGASTNQTIKSILNFRPVRVYRQDQVIMKDLLAVVQAGLYAPSEKNLQPWHVTVITNAGMLEKMTELYKEELRMAGGDFTKYVEENPDIKLFYGAPAAILISGDKSEYAALDCAAALQNMMIAAESLDLAACRVQAAISLFEGEKGKALMKELAIPEGYKPLYSFSLGYPDENPELKARRDDTVKFVR
jgi:nitroreductase